ncbi:hypothetical protein AUEXF2481DRAFT_1459 [Aureobasidium subglaciale EXF-2481]|uniref:Uncharacterized protein n=1 Tax=Aureobasidium subglaciale (strain EXF-2481) TaxID=1043005 RepID=A0A074YQN8_AURSE|nr:uncharacterized protein AUEXF2481DRAFT_1459 [Aureobasidium subglaciale EXF-2481]KER00001.1 hypothetical protein AUEXF2481DRAFT_1459 [Aureobasidium subglaciale EXF-2481]
MATSKTTEIQTVPIAETQGDGSPVRRSIRIAGLNPALEVRAQLQSVNGVKIEARVVYEKASGRQVKKYAIRALDVKLDNLWPGRIIKAVDSYPMVDLDIHPFDLTVNQTRSCGPIGAKWRYMIVLWMTNMGLVAIPLFTLKEVRLSHERCQEFVSITTAANLQWRGAPGTAWAGMPLMMKTNGDLDLGDKCYADLARPHFVNRYEKFFDDVGQIDGGEYCKLMDLYEIMELEQRVAAFARFDDEGIVQAYEPQNAHVPKPGVRHISGKTKKMANKKFARRV